MYCSLIFSVSEMNTTAIWSNCTYHCVQWVFCMHKARDTVLLEYLSMHAICFVWSTAYFFLKQAIDKMLCELNFKYRPIISAHYLDNTREQFMERKILISFVGCYNTGKSTLLNSLLKARLVYCPSAKWKVNRIVKPIPTVLQEPTW